MKSAKALITIILLLSAAVISYALPKTKYVGTGFVSGVEAPDLINGWVGRDISNEIGLNRDTLQYNFISEALAYQYVNKEGESLVFIILDAGNFHHPKVCYTGAGYEIKEMPDTVFDLSDRSLKANTLFTKKENSSSISFYWIVIDKNIAHEWIEQKAKQLYLSLFGKKRVGLMVRIDVPAKEEDIEEATAVAKRFVNELNQVLPEEQADYILGEK